MLEPERVETDLPALDRSDDPRGGAAAWALLAVGLALIVIVIMVIWIWW
jgi:hypothetical protein